jgi:hypothetical protein
VFFPTAGVIPRLARETCAACPVREECLQHALVNNETSGIWGGTTDRERQRIGYAPRPRMMAPRSLCGTDSGYRRHWRDGEQPCQECKTAHTEANREREARKAS